MNKVGLLTSVFVAAVAAQTVIGVVQAPLRAESQAAQEMSFEVISLRPAAPNNRMQFNSSPGRFMARSANVKNLVVLAYDVREFQISGGPGWVDSDRFDISATSEKAFPTKAETGAMLRSLLRDRFHLVVRQESRELQVYGLVIAKGGPKLNPSAEDATLKLDGGPGRAIGSKVSMPLFSQFLSQQLGRNVVDRTDLMGSYDVQLSWSPQNNAAPDGTSPDGPSLFTALQDEMGLKLESQRGPVPFIVIVSIEKPVEN